MRFNIFEDIEMGGLHHGSGADFDVFDPDKVGSAIGTSYGWGFYLTKLSHIADYYADKVAIGQNNKLKDKIRTLTQSYFHDNEIPAHLRSAFSHSVHVLAHERYLFGKKLMLSENKYEKIKHNIENYVKDNNFRAAYHTNAVYYTKEDLASLIDMLNKLYPDIEKHLSEWKDPIRYGIKLVKEGSDFKFIYTGDDVPKKDLKKVINQLKEEGFDYDSKKINDNLDGEALYDYLANEIFDGNGKDASMFLLRAGFDGIAGGSITGTPIIYVVFDPNIIRIVEKTNV